MQQVYYVHRIDNINDTNPVQISTIDWLFIVAVDRYKDRIFYSDESDLWQNNLAGTNESLAKNLFTAPYTITSIDGIDAAPDGMLYIVGTINSVGINRDAITKYDPEANSGNGAIVSTSFDDVTLSAYLASPSDIQVKWPFMYVSVPGGSDGYKILQFAIDPGNNFVLVNHYGTQAASGNDLTTGAFYGPQQFVSLISNGLIIMDTMNSFSRLVHINNNFLFGWDTVGGANGSGVNQFNF